MPSLCCLQRQRHKGGPVGSCEKQGQARTKPRGGVACSRMQPLQRQCSGSAGGQWPACCSIQRAAGWPLPTAFLPSGGLGLRHTLTHTCLFSSSLLTLHSHALLCPVWLEVSVKVNRNRQSYKLITESSPTVYTLLHVGLFPGWNQAYLFLKWTTTIMLRLRLSLCFFIKYNLDT